MASAGFSKGTIREQWQAGGAMSFSVSSVMMPSVPSEPIIRWSRLYPDEDLDTGAPTCMISPLGRTTVMASDGPHPAGVG